MNISEVLEEYRKEYIRKYGPSVDVTKYLNKDLQVMEPKVKSTLEQKFRRRWVGGKWVDERIK